MPCGKMMDSGLVMFGSEPPRASGFVAFEEPLEEESRVNKGLLWAVFGGSIDGGTAGGGHAAVGGAGGDLVVTTHMHATSAAARAAQRAQLIALLAQLRARYAPDLVVVCGDFNESALPPAQQKRVTPRLTPRFTPRLTPGSHLDLHPIHAVAPSLIHTPIPTR
mmetsp:Transcript_9143/g.28977  ORF Transcript_9143/g.28977 Transcript_9143/m.28977 type:complete len:164 (+) Transcript_9143:98-589(+)